MKYVRQIGLLTLISFGIAPSLGAETNWPEFRGGHGDGRATEGQVTTKWSESSNIRWKTAIHGKGWSSPVVWNNQVWITTASVDGKQMFAVGLDRDTGQVIHDKLIFENEEPRFCHPTNSYASPSPAIEQGRVYVHFGSYGTACLDTSNADVIWRRRDFECNHWRGPGASPILYDGRLYVPFDGFDVQYVVAMDTQTGKTVWRRKRNIDYGSDNGDHYKGYCTCRIIAHEGRMQLISPSAAETISYDPETGDEYWRVRHGGMNAATRPVYANGLVYLTNGDSVGRIKPSLLAVRPSGDGNITETHVAWTQTKGTPKRPSPIVVGDLLFMISDDGIAACLDALTGEFVWRQRLGGNFRASPVYCNGLIYCFSLEGEAAVFRADRTFQLVASNQLDEGCQASPAISGNDLLVRTVTHLYCLAPPSP